MTTQSIPAGKRERRPDTRPQEIMEAAMALFTSQGFRATTLDQVADAAGVTKGAIYHYFDGKEDLLLQAMYLWFDNKMTMLEDPAIETTGPASARLRLMIRRMWEDWIDENTLAFIRLLEGELVPDFPDIVIKWHEEKVTPVYDRLETIIELGQESGEFRKDLDGEVFGPFLVAAVTEVSRIRFFKGVSSPLMTIPSDRVLDSMMDVVFRGIRDS